MKYYHKLHKAFILILLYSVTSISFAGISTGSSGTTVNTNSSNTGITVPSSQTNVNTNTTTPVNKPTKPQQLRTKYLKQPRVNPNVPASVPNPYGS